MSTFFTDNTYKNTFSNSEFGDIEIIHFLKLSNNYRFYNVDSMEKRERKKHILRNNYLKI